MAKVHHRRANKAYPNAGIEKGDMYYFAQIKTGPRSSRITRQKTQIRPSQLTSSEYLSELYALQEDSERYSAVSDFDDVPDQLRQIGENARERFENMPEGLQQGDTGQQLEQRADSCESVADEIETLISDWDEESVRETLRQEDPDLDDEDLQEKVNEAESEIISQAQELLGSVET